ncbi:hypothetical protein B0F88_101278 [Methylobacter tundripaludum]|uniref:Uncharacterized protein n=1 Tax=Methylobacter tundripaludum TaxID=173365 RepID=A0A2S6H8F2_9GAMM|nr:hypothetical protein [Methylobacter tundripaludum]PPK73747.1 hypothetical protein B0F88_101278 [Methylobacter tundripaludum]
MGLDHPEQTVWRRNATTLIFRTDTNGNSLEIDLSKLAGAEIQACTRIDSYIKVGDPREPQPYVHAPEMAFDLSGDALLAQSRFV